MPEIAMNARGRLAKARAVERTIATVPQSMHVREPSEAVTAVGVIGLFSKQARCPAGNRGSAEDTIGTDDLNNPIEVAAGRTVVVRQVDESICQDFGFTRVRHRPVNGNCGSVSVVLMNITGASDKIYAEPFEINPATVFETEHPGSFRSAWDDMSIRFLF